MKMACNTNLNKYNIILGSQSPRRKELLEKTGLKFIIKISEVKEEFENYKNIEDAAKSMALLKAKSFKNLKDNDVLICADTLVSINKKILGKPKTSAEAKKMLKILSGKKHKVTTGVVIKSIKKQKIFYDSTIVMFKELSEKDIKYYIKEFKPYDKAGSYAIQEWIGIIGIKWIKGSFFNVMGLPTEKLYSELSPEGKVNFVGNRYMYNKVSNSGRYLSLIDAQKAYIMSIILQSNLDRKLPQKNYANQPSIVKEELTDSTKAGQDLIKALNDNEMPIPEFYRNMLGITEWQAGMPVYYQRLPEEVRDIPAEPDAKMAELIAQYS